MDSKPLVSVCMPVYNAEKFLLQALDSVFSQTYKKIEVICVDDGSTDSSLDLLSCFEDRIKIVESTNNGAPCARNMALIRARGDMIQFFDADDILESTKIESQVEVLQETGSDLVFCNKRIMKGDAPPVELPSPHPLTDLDPFLYCLRYNLPGGRAVIDTEVPLHRRNLLMRIGGFRLGVDRAQDKDLALRLAAAGAKFSYLDEILVTCRDHDGPRISRQVRSPHFHVDYFISMIDVLLSDSMYTLTPARRQELSIVLSRFSKSAYRNGSREAARIGFDVASKLSRYSDPQQGALYSFLQKTLGYESVERLRELTHR